MQQLAQLAPIIIFAYNRLDSLLRTIQYLLKNEDVESADLIIYSDSWKNEVDRDGVLTVRNYLQTVKGFKSVTIIEREENYGLAKNIIEGVTEVINKHGRVIVLEDDLLTSENFLSYMNQALDFYENNSEIFAISGYTGKLPSLPDMKDDVYLSYRPSSWGWGTWKNQWDNIDWDVVDFTAFIKNKTEVRKFNRGGIDMARMLRHCVEGKNHSWAIRWSYAMFKQDKFCVYPKVSKIQNIGFGDGATNCKGIDIYQTDLDKTKNETFKFVQNIKINHAVVKEFKYQFSYTNKLLKRIENYLNRAHNVR